MLLNVCSTTAASTTALPRKINSKQQKNDWISFPITSLQRVNHHKPETTRNITMHCRIGSSMTASFWMLLMLSIQMLMTLSAPLSALALPITSKPIESTAENLAWQAWLKLPAEQKLLVKSRKVTPKSIFTLPLRQDCPDGHQKVDTKCIPVVIGSNDLLTDPSILGLLVGNIGTVIEFDYDDEEYLTVPEPHTQEKPKQTERTNVEENFSFTAVTPPEEEQKPPKQDEPIKFNLFFDKFPEYETEDYSLQLESEKFEENQNFSSNAAENATVSAALDLDTDATKISEANSLGFLLDLKDSEFQIDAISLPASNAEEQANKLKNVSVFKDNDSVQLVTQLVDDEASNNDIQELLKTESLLPMLNQTASTLSIASSTTSTTTESSVLSDANQTTAFVSSSSIAHKPAQEHDEITAQESSINSVNLKINDDDDMTTMTNLMQEMEEEDMKSDQDDKIEYTRSVTQSTLYQEQAEDQQVPSAETEQDKLVKELEDIFADYDELTTLTPTTWQTEPDLDGTESETETEIESTTIATAENQKIINNIVSQTDFEQKLLTNAENQQPAELQVADEQEQQQEKEQEQLKELLLQQEQALKDYEELQRMRKGETEKAKTHVVMKKSKVEPVQIVAEKTTTTATATTTMSTTAKRILSMAKAAAAETTTEATTTTTTKTIGTVTPLLAENSNKNNDRFYYQHFAVKQDLESSTTINLAAEITAATTTTSQQTESATTRQKHNNNEDEEQTQQQDQSAATSNIKTLKSTKASEIDLAKELSLINALVKGKLPAEAAALTVEATTANPIELTATTTSQSIIRLATPSSLAISDSLKAMPSGSAIEQAASESSVESVKPTLSTTQIWSKIMPFMTTHATEATTITAEFPATAAATTTTSSVLSAETDFTTPATLSATSSDLVISTSSSATSLALATSASASNDAVSSATSSASNVAGSSATSSASNVAGSSATTMASATSDSNLETSHIASATSPLPLAASLSVSATSIPIIETSPLIAEETSTETHKAADVKSSTDTITSSTARTLSINRNLSKNRSLRNSKIIRINGFNTISSTTTTPTPFTDSNRSSSSSSSSSTSSSSSSSSTTLPTTTPSTTTTTTTTETYDFSDMFWWLPIGWRLDKPKSTEESTTAAPETTQREEQPLLLRFWSHYHNSKS